MAKSDMQIEIEADIANRRRLIRIDLRIPNELLERLPKFQREYITRIMRDTGPGTRSTATILHLIADFIAEADGSLPDTLDTDKSPSPLLAELAKRAINLED